MGRLVLRRARCLEAGAISPPRDVWVEDGLLRERPTSLAGASEIDLEERVLLPAIVNALDVLDLATLPPLGRPPHASVYEWTETAEAADAPHSGSLRVPLVDRLFLGGMRNVLAGVAAVLHHHPYHRSLGRRGFPVRVQDRYGFAHSPGRTPRLRSTYRTTDRRIPWLVRAAEGADPALGREIDDLVAANVLRQNTVIVHGTAIAPGDAARLAAARAAVVWCPEADRLLYGRTAPVVSLREAGVRLGLGSDSAAAGGRDALSNLAAARREGVFDDATLVHLATREGAEVARLPCGGFASGSRADLLATDSVEALLRGERAAVALLLVGGGLVYGDAVVVAQASTPLEAIVVDGARKALAAPLGRRLSALLRRHPVVREARWARGVGVDESAAARKRML